MNFWSQRMDWQLDKDWECEICGARSLIWGIPHGICRCDICHTQYDMRDDSGGHVTKPICRLKPEYYQAVKELWQEKEVPIEEMEELEERKNKLNEFDEEEVLTEAEEKSILADKEYQKHKEEDF